jgi:hypothetical protein
MDEWTIDISQNGTYTLRVDVPSSGQPQFPIAREFRPAMANLDKAWYEATRRFGTYNYHPDRCEDWNLESGGDTDLGEPLVAPMDALVTGAHDWGGKVGKVLQLLALTPAGELIVWSGWHLQEITVAVGNVVQVGDPVGAIGNAGGVYAAHLHEQICVVNRWGIPAPNTFASDSRYDWRQPSRFYIEHGFPQAEMDRLTRYDGA